MKYCAKHAGMYDAICTYCQGEIDDRAAASLKHDVAKLIRAETNTILVSGVVVAYDAMQNMSINPRNNHKYYGGTLALVNGNQRSYIEFPTGADYFNACNKGALCHSTFYTFICIARDDGKPYRGELAELLARYDQRCSPTPVGSHAYNEGILRTGTADHLLDFAYAECLNLSVPDVDTLDEVALRNLLLKL